MSYNLAGLGADPFSTIGSSIAGGAISAISAADMQRLVGPLIPEVMNSVQRKILPWLLPVLVSTLLVNLIVLYKVSS